MRTRLQNRACRAFTLIEILIVVVILGILAAIVIPQFTDASQDAMEANLVSQLQTIRSQIELYDVQNPQAIFDPLDMVQNPANLDVLVTGQYLQSPPKNPLQGGISNVSATPAMAVAWTYSDPNGWGVVNLYAVNATGGDFDFDGDGDAD